MLPAPYSYENTESSSHSSSASLALASWVAITSGAKPSSLA